MHIDAGITPALKEARYKGERVIENNTKKDWNSEISPADMY
jgi:hypothetical protein